ncbi:MAG: glycosyltransferase family 2 protein [Rhizobiaceae bacterium]|nr:glycosyltransferase family 2 protein [Rhizobiaceae bacterium]
MIKKILGMAHSNSGFEYPLTDNAQNIWGMSYSQQTANFVRKLLPVRHKPRPQNIEIWPAGDAVSRPLTDEDFPLIFVVHNGRRFLPSFLKHYRQIGVTRFVCVDDNSNDGTTEYLARQADVDVHFSNVRYREAGRSKAWRELLANKYGYNRWYLNVDVDEYLFTGCNNKIPIGEYANRLYSKGVYRLPAPMIDMMPENRLEDAIFTGEDATMPWEICPYFDSKGYQGHLTSGGIKLLGGPRRRLWGATAELMKYPLLYWDKRTSMGVSIHSPRPLYRNHAPFCGALLHFKIFADVEQVAAGAKNSGQYFDGGHEYKLMAEYFEENRNKPLRVEHSVRFSSESDLIKHGFLKKIL